MRIRRQITSAKDALKSMLYKSGKKKLYVESLDIADEVLHKAGISRTRLVNDSDYMPWVEEPRDYSITSSAIDSGKHNRVLRERRRKSPDSKRQAEG